MGKCFEGGRAEWKKKGRGKVRSGLKAVGEIGGTKGEQRESGRG